MPWANVLDYSGWRPDLSPSTACRSANMGCMDKLKKALSWLKVVLTSAPTVIAALTVAVGLVAQSLVDVLPDQYDGNVTKVAAWIVLALTGLANIVRRVTPVVESARGVLPKGE